MRIFALSAALAMLGWSALAYDFRPARIPATIPQPRGERMLREQVRYLLGALPPGEIPNESENAIRPLTGTAVACAVCLKFAGCEEPAETRAAVIRILRDVTRTHLTGGGKTASGRPWGHHWQSAFWAYEAAFAAWLLWPDLPEDVRQAVAAMTVDEADRFVDMPPPYAEFLDTKAEENAWNSMVLVLASEVLPDHPHRPRWRERALGYMISAFATRADRTSDRMVDGRPVRDWVKGANVHSDFTLENHGFVHPDYMMAISMNLTNALVYRLLGRPAPQAVLFNAQPMYDSLKFFSLPDGGLFYPNATDWNLHELAHTWNVHTLMERVGRDRQAGALAKLGLATLERMQARNPDGRLYAPGEYTSYRNFEAHAGFLTSTALLSAKLWPAAEDPKPLATVWKELEGGRMFDDGRFFVLRAPGALSSFAWGLRIMGQTIPFDADPVVNPMNHSYLGLAQDWNDTDRPGQIGVGSLGLQSAVSADTVRFRTVIPWRENGAMSVTASSVQSGRTHMFSFTALPSGKSVFMERFGAEVEGPVHSGLVSLVEEPAWVYGKKARRIERDDHSWLNVDDRLGFAVAASGSIQVRPDYHSQALILNDAPRPLSIDVIVTLPGATAAETREFAAGPFRLSVKNPAIAAVLVDGLIVASNFSSAPTTTEAEYSGHAYSISVNGISSRILRAK